MTHAANNPQQAEETPARVVSGGLVLHLVLTHHWYDEAERGAKCVEYRRLAPIWVDRIYNRRDQITHVRFARGYTRITLTRPVEKIDIGKCPIAGLEGDYIRIHFSQNTSICLRSQK
jgi:hypothetical protein